jgi:hypothetical protein
MKNIFMISLLLVLAATTFAQKPSAEAIRKRFSLGVTINNDFWQKVPSSVDTRIINQGADVYATYNFPMDRNNHMFFFAGAGIGCHNFYYKSNLTLNTDNVTEFTAFPAKVNGHDITVKKNKLALTYFDIPFGFTYKASNKIHGTLGFKVGWGLNNHTKYKGTDYSDETAGRTVRLKSAALPNMQSIHYGPYATIGYKWFGLTAYYQVTSIFQKDLGPQIYPISVGITLRPF